jgi:hypothetical protein
MNRTTTALLSVLLLWGTAGAQLGSRGYFYSGLTYQRWTMEGVESPLGQTAAPLAVVLPLSKQAAVHFSNVPAWAKFGDAKLSGLSDTWIKATYVFPGERFMIHFGVGAPTGKTGLKTEELFLSQILSENVFQFRLPLYGQGLNIKLGAAVALPLNEKTVLGFGIHGIIKKAYHPVEDDQIEFNPGGEISLFTGLDLKLGPKSKWTIDADYTHYGRDAVNGEQVYGSGAKVSAHSRLTAAVGKTLLNLSVAFRQKGKNETWSGISLESESKNSNGNQFEMDAEWQVVRRAAGSFSLLGSGRWYSDNQYGMGKASVTGGGAGLTLRLSPRASFFTAVKALSGKLRGADESTPVRGLDAGAGLTIEF